MSQLKLDVFLRCAPVTWLRVGLMMACVERWRMEPLANLRILVCQESMGGNALHNAVHPEVALSKEQFHWVSREYAEERAQTDPYVLADDDHLILGKGWLDRAYELWQQNAGVVMLSSTSSIGVERPREVEEAPVVSMSHSQGATCLVQPGLIPKDLYGKAPDQDNVVCRWLDEHRHRRAMMRDVRYNHLGYGYSQAEPAWWNNW